MPQPSPSIRVQPDGPYLVEGGVPLVRKAPVVSEHGEPLAWQTGEPHDAGAAYMLCRCGQSRNKPFCDGSHVAAGFDGTETADPAPVASRQKHYPGARIVVHDDRSLCLHAGFCGNRLTNVWKMVPHTDDTQVRAEVIAMVERCPSGALTYSLDDAGAPVEPDFAARIGLVPDGPLWVTGGIPVERADGAPCETRPRVGLCRCGASKNKPLCDGSHSAVGFRHDGDPRGARGSGGAAPGPSPAQPGGGESAAPADAQGRQESADDHPPHESADPGPPAAPDGAAPAVDPGQEAGRYVRYMAEFIGFTDADAEAVRRTAELVIRQLPEIITQFYDQVLRYPPTRRFFEADDGTIDQAYLELRMRHQVNFWTHVAAAELDDDFAAYVAGAGRAHTARGADPTVYVAERYVIGMVGFVQHAISRALMKALAVEPDRAFADLALEAWDKLLMVVLEMLARAYRHEHVLEAFEPRVAVDHAAIADLARHAFAAQRPAAPDVPHREVPVAPADAVPVGERRIVEVDGRSIGVFHLRDGWHAVANFCLHRGGPIAAGPLDGTILTCPWHGYQYDVTSGRCVADPLAVLETFAVTVRDGRVWLRVPEPR